MTKLCLLSFALVFSVNAEVRVNSLFTDDMILQRDMPANVFGTAADGEKITVKINGQTASTVAKGGKWLISLKAMKAGGPYILNVNELKFKNVVLGDVWICTGQSNMDFDFSRFMSTKTTVGKKYTAIAKSAGKFKNIRLLVAQKKPGAKIENIVTIPAFKNKWQVSTTVTAKLTSAVGYVFGKELHEHLNVPIGLIDSNKGGSPIETWMSEKALAAAGKKVGKKSYYNGNLFPLQKFAIKGVIWYQGESNAKSVASSLAYAKTFKEMIKSWRAEWKQENLPFLYVQLAAWRGRPSVDTTWPLLRESQDKALELPYVGAALAIDKGAIKDIHPPLKISVSHRLALNARKIVYGEDIVFSGPRYKSHKVNGNSISVTFSHVGSGLIKHAYVMEKLNVSGDNLVGFEISADGKTYVKAQALIQGDSVVVSSPEVKSPKHVRYAWTGFPSANLFNKEQLPTHPFRTDTNVPKLAPTKKSKKKR